MTRFTWGPKKGKLQNSEEGKQQRRVQKTLSEEEEVSSSKPTSEA